MKTKIFASLTLSAAAVIGLTGCLDEVQPSGSTITQEQLNSSVKAGSATLYAMPTTILKSSSDASDWHGDFGYPAMMMIRDAMTGDMTVNVNGTSYDHLAAYAQLRSMGEGHFYPQRIWNYYTTLVLSANKGAQAFPEDVEEPQAMGCRALALAFRAMAYLDMARWFEYLPCEGTSPNLDSTEDDGTPNRSVLNLTVPIVTEKTTDTEAANNPRATRTQMAEFIKGDLEYATEHIANCPDEFKTNEFPNLAVVYGLYARLYMWLEDYGKAKEYADMAIAESHRSPLTEAQWTNPSTGFNNAAANPSWMWSAQLTSENRAVTTGICNFTSFMSAEAKYGYANVGAHRDIDWKMYQRISDTDFRKLSWMPHSGLGLLAKIQLAGGVNLLTFRNKFKLSQIKFRPGQGEIDDYLTGSATAIPLMRLEEMNFISIESQAHLNAAEGKNQIEAWMKAYRDPNYTCKVSSQEDIIEEIIFQKRVEFWGEGQTLFDIKRLNYSVTRGYEGTNWYEAARFNTNGRPAWMNMVIVMTEGNSNAGVRGWNNPGFMDAYETIKDADVKFNKGNW